MGMGKITRQYRRNNTECPYIRLLTSSGSKNLPVTRSTRRPMWTVYRIEERDRGSAHTR